MPPRILSFFFHFFVIPNIADWQCRDPQTPIRGGKESLSLSLSFPVTKQAKSSSAWRHPIEPFYLVFIVLAVMIA